MGKQLIVSGSKFPGTTVTWTFINDAIREVTKALGSACGHKGIVTGVEAYIPPAQPGVEYVTEGFISYNGDLLLFKSGQKYDHVEIVTETLQAPYLTSGGLVPRDIYRTVYARCVPAPGANTFPFADLVRLRNIRTITDNPLFTQELLDKLNGIAALAEVNVQSDWAVSNPESDAFIKNKPNTFTRFGKHTWSWPSHMTELDASVYYPNLSELGGNYFLTSELSYAGGTSAIPYYDIIYKKNANDILINARKLSGGNEYGVKLITHIYYY